MPDEAVAGDPRYWAFISYSHEDAAFGRRLHRRLERYALPRRLVGRAGTNGAVPRRIAPIFRDREEFPAANDLSTEVRTALQASRSLIVVCSPAAAASTWVTREVELFRALHPNRPVLAAIHTGDPSRSFPDALRWQSSAGEIIEPLAADFRSGRDGWRLGLLKLVAGIAGIGLDEIVQRDAQRRLQRVTAVTAVALAAMLVMGLLTVFALNARSEAERQRSEAEGLVQFMLTDLRDRLKGVGRLDVLTAVNERALRYYGDEPLGRLPADSLERRARLLNAMGQDDETRGRGDAALAEFHEARRTTAALLAAAPNNPDRIFDQAQSEFWTGYVDYARGRYEAARPAFLEYKKLAERLVAIAPSNPKYSREAGYADGNLCSIEIEEKHHAESLRSCKSALDHMQAAAGHLDAASGIDDDLINRHAWMADAYLLNADIAQAKAERLIEEAELNARIKADSRNMDLKEIWVALQIALAALDSDSGKPEAARTRLSETLAAVDSMIQFDPSNRTWSRQRDFIRGRIAKLDAGKNQTGVTP